MHKGSSTNNQPTIQSPQLMPPRRSAGSNSPARRPPPDEVMEFDEEELPFALGDVENKIYILKGRDACMSIDWSEIFFELLLSYRENHFEQHNICRVL